MKNAASATPDQVCASYANKKVQLTIRPLESDATVLLIEGDQHALEFLGQLLLAQASSSDCAFQLAPDSAGKAFFSRQSRTGLYLHRVPCPHSAKPKRGKKGSAAETRIAVPTARARE